MAAGQTNRATLEPGQSKSQFCQTECRQLFLLRASALSFMAEALRGREPSVTFEARERRDLFALIPNAQIRPRLALANKILWPAVTFSDTILSGSSRPLVNAKIPRSEETKLIIGDEQTFERVDCTLWFWQDLGSIIIIGDRAEKPRTDSSLGRWCTIGRRNPAEEIASRISSALRMIIIIIRSANRCQSRAQTNRTNPRICAQIGFRLLVGAACEIVVAR